MDEALSVGRVTLDNAINPKLPGLSEAAQANMESFLQYVLMILPALRIDMFISGTRPVIADEEVEESGAVFQLTNKKQNLSATAVLQDGDFIVQAGSSARKQWEAKKVAHEGYAKLHGQLVKQGVLQEQEDRCIFVKSYHFSSPSAAAAVIHGRPANGQTDWKYKGTGQSYKQWEASQLATLEPFFE